MGGLGDRRSSLASTPSGRLRPVDLRRWAEEAASSPSGNFSLLMHREAALEASKAAVRARVYAAAAAEEAKSVKARVMPRKPKEVGGGGGGGGGGAAKVAAGFNPQAPRTR